MEKEQSLKQSKYTLKVAINILTALILIELILKLIGVNINMILIVLTFGLFILSNLISILLKEKKNWFDYFTLLFISLILVQIANSKYTFISQGYINPVALTAATLWFIGYYFEKINLKENNAKARNYLFFGAAIIIIFGSFLKAASFSFGNYFFWTGIILGLTSICIEFYHWIKN